MLKMRSPDWPKGYKRPYFLGRPRYPLTPSEFVDHYAILKARELRDQAERNSGTTGTWMELLYVNTADFAAYTNSTSEGSLLAPGPNELPTLPALLFFNKQGRNRAIDILASGVLSTTSTPTITFQARLGTTAGSTFLSGTSVGVSAAITTASGVSNKWWELRLRLQVNVVGTGAGNSTLSGAGYVSSPGGFASPFQYPLEPTTPDTATWTATFDNSVTQYINLSATWSAASASNTITCKQLWVGGLN